MDRHRILLVTQVLSMIQSFALAGIVFSGQITVTWILWLQVAQGIINSFDTPARQAFVVEMVEDRADLPNAIALNSSMVNVSRILGPSIGGIVIAAVGEGWCFFADGVSYIAVIASLLLMTVVRKPKEPRNTNVIEELTAGFRYVSSFSPVQSSLILLSLVSILGMTPIGSLLAGLPGDRIGPTLTITIGGTCCLLAAFWFGSRLPGLRAIVRPIYLESGIIAAAEIEAGTKAL
ncbi:MAG: MFS transporter [Gemmatimonadaceae bacterium]